MSPYKVQKPVASSLLFPVLRSSAPVLLENAMSSIPRMRACRFSSVTSGFRPRKIGSSAARYAEKIDSIGTVWKWMPRRWARTAASSLLIPAVYREGMAMPVTLPGPRARAASTAVSAESIPPERPMTAERKPVLRA